MRNDMKKIKFQGKLSLNTETMAKLNKEQQRSIFGGDDTNPTTGPVDKPSSDNLCTSGSCVTLSIAQTACIRCV